MSRQIKPLTRSAANDMQGVVLSEVASQTTVDAGLALVGFFFQQDVPSKKAEFNRRKEQQAIYRLPPVEILRLSDAYVETGACVAIKAGAFVPDTLRGSMVFGRGYKRHLLDRHKLFMPERPVARTFEYPAVLVGVPGHNYFHWLFEAVVRWLFARDLVEDVRLLVARPYDAMQTSALDALGVSRSKVAVMPAWSLLPVNDLVVASRGLKGGRHISPIAVEALRRAMTYGGSFSERVFISRACAKQRRIVNEKAVRRVIRRHGFSVVEPDGMSVRAQALRFERAEVVLGVHGAGLANCAFSPPGASLIELQPAGLDAVRMPLYWNLAAAGGQRYAQIICAGAAGQAHLDVGRRDIHVDVDHLDATLSQILS